jgi:RNA polymerase sigma-70 factor (ECF subfamily)
VTVTSERLRAGESTAQLATDEFKTVFLQNYARVYNVLFRLVGNQADAEDLTLETFLKLWQQQHFHADNLGGWLYRVATRLGYNSLRATKRRTQYEESAGRDAIDRADVSDPAREAERADERTHVHEVLSRLSERDAQLLVLRHSGLSYKEIADALNVSPNSVGTLLTRAEEEFERRYLEGGHDAPQR